MGPLITIASLVIAIGSTTTALFQRSAGGSDTGLFVTLAVIFLLLGSATGYSWWSMSRKAAAAAETVHP